MSLLNILRAPSKSASPKPVARELARRVNDGIDVVLHWHPTDDCVTLSVDVERTGERLRLPVPRDRALHAFYHPFVYAA